VRTLSLKFIVENGKEIVSQVAHFIMSQIFVIGGFFQDGPRTIVADLDKFGTDPRILLNLNFLINICLPHFFLNFMRGSVSRCHQAYSRCPLQRSKIHLLIRYPYFILLILEFLQFSLLKYL